MTKGLNLSDINTMAIVDFLKIIEGFRAEDLAQRKAHVLDAWMVHCAKSGKDINEYVKALGD